MLLFAPPEMNREARLFRSIRAAISTPYRRASLADSEVELGTRFFSMIETERCHGECQPPLRQQRRLDALLLVVTERTVPYEPKARGLGGRFDGRAYRFERTEHGVPILQFAASLHGG